MNRQTHLRRDALAIWNAGVDAVRSDHLVQQALRVHGSRLQIGKESLPLDAIRRIVVVGCGKAGAGMAAGVETALGQGLLEAKRVEGWINVPEDCVTKLSRIHLHGARPAGVNEPTEAGVQGSEKILELVQSLGPDDLCLCLISGGGSALMPASATGITLADKQAITKHLSGAGANIQQLNAVRKQLSRVKGGRLARACGAGRLVSLIISDVLGDPLDVIASGPTVPDSSTPREAQRVLDEFDARAAGIGQNVFDFLERTAEHSVDQDDRMACQVTNLIIGNNATAVEAAACEAEARGYTTTQEAITRLEGEAEAVGRRLAAEAIRLSNQPGKHCLISGGEPTVRLAPSSERGLGGRNQQLALAALEHFNQQPVDANGCENIVLLSGGTDGEDGPTDAAGALIDAQLAQAGVQQELSPAEYLSRNDAYHFFGPLDGLIKTGPTNTNVCDLRVIVTDGPERR